MLFFLGIFSLKDELSLEKNSLLIESEVINWRIHNSKYNKNSHEVQYTFSLPNDPVKYSRGDFMGRKNLWSELPVKLWDETKATKKVTVIYNSKNPWNSKIPGKSRFPDIYTMLILGGFSSLMCIFAILKLRRT